MSIRIAEEIINGRRLNREDDLAFFMEEDLDSLYALSSTAAAAAAERIANSVPSHHATMQR